MTQCAASEGGFHASCSRELSRGSSKGNTLLLFGNENYKTLCFLVIESNNTESEAGNKKVTASLADIKTQKNVFDCTLFTVKTSGIHILCAIIVAVCVVTCPLYRKNVLAQQHITSVIINAEL